MATEKKLKDRENAKKSGVPRTPKGKGIFARNARKHGLRPDSSALPNLRFSRCGSESERLRATAWSPASACGWANSRLMGPFAQRARDADEPFCQLRSQIADNENQTRGPDLSPS